MTHQPWAASDKIKWEEARREKKYFSSFFIIRKVIAELTFHRLPIISQRSFINVLVGERKNQDNFRSFRVGSKHARCNMASHTRRQCLPQDGRTALAASPRARGGRRWHSTAEPVELMLRYLKPGIFFPVRRQRDVLWSSATVVPGTVQMAAVWLPGAKRNLHKLRHTPSSKSK